MIAVTATELPDTHALESTKLPRGDSDCNAVANCCRKPLKLAVSALPPKSVTRVSKLCCNELVALLAVALLAVALAAVVLAVVLEVAVALEVAASELDCDCNASIKFCMKFLNAAATSFEELVLALELVLAVLLALVVDESVAPMDANALKIALIKPPPDGGGGDALVALAVLPAESD